MFDHTGKYEIRRNTFFNIEWENLDGELRSEVEQKR